MAFARLAPGISMDTAQEEMKAVAAGLSREFAATNDRWTTVVRSIKDDFIPAMCAWCC